MIYDIQNNTNNLKAYYIINYIYNLKVHTYIYTYV